MGSPRKNMSLIDRSKNAIADLRTNGFIGSDLDVVI